MTVSELGAEGRGSLFAFLARRARRDLPFFVAAAFVFGFDQLTKAIVRGSLAVGESWPSDDWLVKITHVTNSGAAFGVLQGQGLFLTVTAVIAIGAIVFYYAFPPLEHGIVSIVLGLLLGGALGNLLDRLRYGHVTDFIDFPRYPEFNVADSSICIGLALLAWFILMSERHREADGDGG